MLKVRYRYERVKLKAANYGNSLITIGWVLAEKILALKAGSWQLAASCQAVKLPSWDSCELAARIGREL